MDNDSFEVMPINGSVTDFMDIETQYLRYSNLVWEDAVTLCKLSFDQGFQVVIWRSQGDGRQEDAKT